MRIDNNAISEEKVNKTGRNIKQHVLEIVTLPNPAAKTILCGIVGLVQFKMLTAHWLQVEECTGVKEAIIMRNCAISCKLCIRIVST